MGCHGANVVNTNPAVRFTRPPGAVLYLEHGGGVARAVFNGQKRSAPVLCEAAPAVVDVSARGASLRHTLRVFAQRPGAARVQLHGPDGALWSKGRLCIFPTLEAAHPGRIMGGYTIEIPARVIQRLRAGHPVAMYQSYLPAKPKGPRWQHLAWVLYLDPRR